jgi:TonB family protein
MSWPEPSADRLAVDASARAAKFAQSLKQHVHDGLTPDLALDLALNELVVAAAKATHASAAAVALARGDDMVCRATTGDYAPDLGIPLHTRTGLSGACIRSRSPQNCRDTDSDDRVDAEVSRRLAIRSILVVPILDGQESVGIIEVFSPQAGAFSQVNELQLQEFALDCLKLRQLSIEIAQGAFQKLEEHSLGKSAALVPAAGIDVGDPALQLVSVPKIPERDFSAQLDTLMAPSDKRRSGADFWTYVLAALVTAAAVALILLAGYRVGWLGGFSRHPAPVVASQAPPPDQNPRPATAEPSEVKAEVKTSEVETAEVKAAKNPMRASRAVPSAAPLNGGLVVYERGKVIYRSQPTPSKPEVREPASVATGTHKVSRVWLAPAAAEARLHDRVEPEYPADARAAGRSGDVTLEILVRKNGSVASVRTLKGDRLLAAAAAAAVLNWHYEPYQVKGHAREFQTAVTLKFSVSQ